MHPNTVMVGLVPTIHAYGTATVEGVDGVDGKASVGPK
jgi:hypothetical protein